MWVFTVASSATCQREALQRCNWYGVAFKVRCWFEQAMLHSAWPCIDRVQLSGERERERELEQIIVKPPRDMCSKSTENCASTKCCQVTGYNCFYKKQGVAACMKSCTPGKDGVCTMPHELVPLKDTTGTPGLSLFCFSVYTKDTGSTKTSHELELGFVHDKD